MIRWYAPIPLLLVYFLLHVQLPCGLALPCCLTALLLPLLLPALPALPHKSQTGRSLVM